MRGEDQWDKSGHDVILSLEYNRDVGHPKKNRTRGKDVSQNAYKSKKEYNVTTCENKCGYKGYNSKTNKGTIIMIVEKSD